MTASTSAASSLIFRDRGDKGGRGGSQVGWHGGLTKDHKKSREHLQKIREFKLCIFQDHYIMGPNKQVSKPIAQLYRLISQPKNLLKMFPQN